MSFKLQLTSEEKRRRLERKKRFDDDGAAAVSTDAAVSVDGSALKSARTVASDRRKRKRRKCDRRKEDGGGSSSGSGFVGTCRDLEKPYLRLTTFPRPETVRPPPVLAMALDRAKRRYAEEEDYPFISEQMKSVRQDLTVQGIRDELALDVYETHARMALENGDVNEFNQCQSMIKNLTGDADADGEGGGENPDEEGVGFGNLSSHGGEGEKCAARVVEQSDSAADEFASYRLLYALVVKNWRDVNREFLLSSRVVLRMMRQRQRQRRVIAASARSGGGHDVEDSSVASSSCIHAQDVVRAVLNDNHVAFFRLYDEAPNLSGYLMDFLVQRVRVAAYERMVASYGPTSIDVAPFLVETLSFHDAEEAKEFLKKCGAVLVGGGGSGDDVAVDCKASRKT